MSAKPAFLLASANPSADQDDLRRDLEWELERIRDTFFDVFGSDLEVLYYPRFTTDQFLAIASSDFAQRIVGFHYAGHGEVEALLFQDEHDQSEKAFASGIERILVDWPHLRVVFLNCCLSASLAEGLATDERLVLASPYLLNSSAAREMAEGFYKGLTGRGKRFTDALDIGFKQIGLKSGPPFSADGADRGLVTRRDREEVPPMLKWEEVWQAFAPNSPVLEQIFRDEVKMVKYALRRPPRHNQPEQKLLGTGLAVDFQTQEAAITRGIKQGLPGAAKGFIFHGVQNFSVPWLRFRVLGQLIRDRDSIVLDFERIASVGNANEIWKLVADRVGAAHPVNPENTIHAVAKRLAFNMADLVFIVDNALMYGPGQLEQVLREFWLPLAEGVDRYWRENPEVTRYGQLWGLFFAEYPTLSDQSLQLGPAIRLAESQNRILQILDGTRPFTQEEIKEFLIRHGSQVLTEENRPNLEEVDPSDPYLFKAVQIWGGSNGGRPKEVLQMICKLSGASYELLEPKIFNL